MKFKDGAARKRFDESVRVNVDPYGARVVSYSKDWAEMMEREFAQGQALIDIAEKTSREADTDGITGFMYGCAVALLADCWVHGEELRRWHNLHTQIGYEGEEANRQGGVLNPALLSFKE